MTEYSLIYREHPPCAALAPYVECYWTGLRDINRGTRGVHRVLPDGCIDLLAEFGYSAAADRIDGLGRAATLTSVKCSVVGPMTRPLITEPGHTEFVGVRFKPGKAIPLIQASAGELTDEILPLDEFLGRDGSVMSDRLAAAPRAAERIHLLEQLLLSALAKSPGSDASLDGMVRLVLGRRGAISIADLSEVAGISRQHVARKFERYVGLSPKLFCRIVRFRDLLKIMDPSGPADWAEAALDLGYYDQAHMIMDFKEFSGLTPTAFLASR